MPIPVSGLFETHVNVRNLEASVKFYRDTLGLELAYLLEERRVAFFWLGGRGHAMLGVWETGSSPLFMRLHLAFACSREQVLAAPAILKAAGIVPRGFNGEPTDEPIVYGWMPAVALFFHDPDGHNLEYLAMLLDKPRPEVGVLSYSAWQALMHPA